MADPLLLALEQGGRDAALMDPLNVVIGVATTVAIMAFVTGAIYLRGGSSAVRGQARQLGLLAVGLVAVQFAVLILGSGGTGPAFTLALIAISVVWLISSVARSRRGEGPLSRETWSSANRVPGFRTLIAAWVGFVVVGTILLILVASSRS